jgi:hypothetical protein
MTGATLSMIEIVRLTLESVRPQASVAVQVSVTAPLQLPDCTVVKVDKFEVPLIKQFPISLLVKGKVLALGNKVLQVIVMSCKAVIVGKLAGLTVMILETAATGRPQTSFGAVHVSVTVPPHAPGELLKVDKLDVPLISQAPVNPLLKAIALAAGILPQATVIGFSGVIVGTAAGLTVISLETEATVLPQISVAVQVSVTVPPHTPGVALKVLALEVPLIRHPPLSALLKLMVLGAGIPPQATVIGPGAVIVGNAAGLTVINLETEAKVRPQLSIAVQVSVTVPPQAPGSAEKVLGFEVPLIKQSPLRPLVKLIVLEAGIAPQDTDTEPGATIVGKAAGSTVIILETEAIVLPQTSVAVQVSVKVPPQAPGAALKVDGLELPLMRHPPLKPLL